MSDPTPTTPPKPEAKKPAPPKPPEAAKPAPLSPPTDPSTIPVRLVEWERHMKLPGKQSEQTSKTERNNNGGEWVVVYVVALEQFRITYTDTVRPERGGVRMVPLARALSWEPA